jgi:ATP-binding cassette subfamily F protein 2
MQLLLDEPTNHLDMESIDALAKAVNEFEGGMVLVSHDMRLISQVAKEIWICDNKTITKYQGDIMNFKMDMRAQMGIDGTGSNTAGQKLRGDASVKASDKPKEPKAPKKPEPKLEVIKPTKPVVASIPEEKPSPEPVVPPKAAPLADDATATTVSTGASGTSSDSAPKKYIPPHLRKKMQQQESA